MDKYTVFNMIKNYNKSVEDPKDSDKNRDSLWWGVIFVMALHAILFIAALVLLIVNQSRLKNNIFLFLLLSLFFTGSHFPIIGSIVIIILLFIFRNKAISSFRF